MKFVVVDLPLDDVEVKDGNRVRRVRTPEGVRKYGQPIGSIITRDSIARAKRRSGGKLSAPKPTKPAAEKPAATPGRINRVDAAERMHGTGSRQHREAQRRWPDGGPTVPVAERNTKPAPESRSLSDEAVSGDPAELALLESRPDIELENTDSGGFTPEGATLDYYTRSGYRDINNTLRFGDEPSDELQEHIDRLDEMIAAQEIPVTLKMWRGIGPDVLPEGNLVGSEIEDQSYTSVSLEPRVAENFYSDGGAVIETIIPKGSHGWYVEEGERELILPRGGKYKVVGDENRDGKRYLRVELVAPGSVKGEGDGGRGTEEGAGDGGRRGPVDLEGGGSEGDSAGQEEVEDVRAAELQVGDRVVLDTGYDGGAPATVTGVDRDGRDLVLDVTYANGSTDTVYMDPTELVPRVPKDVLPEPDPVGDGKVGPAELQPGDRFDPGNGQVFTTVSTVDAGELVQVTFTKPDGEESTAPFGKTVRLTRVPDADPEPEPDLELLPVEVAVDVADLKVGDQIADTDGDPLTVIAVRKNKSTDLYDVTTVDGSGKRETNSFAGQVALARTREAREPDPLPADAVNARVALATYQRRSLAVLDLDHDDTVPADAQQAAARIRLRQPITADQSAALTAHLTEVAAKEPNARKQRALQRLAGSVGAVDAQIKGEDVPVVREADKMDKTTVGEVGEGDWIAIRRPGGSDDAQIGKVTGVRSLMGGRLREVTLVDPQGSETKRVLTPGTTAFVLPDLGSPVPVTEDLDEVGPVIASRISRGDTVMLPDTVRGGLTEVTVDSIKPMGDGFSVTGTRVTDGSSIGTSVKADRVVNRTKVNPERPIGRQEVQVGDFIDWANGRTTVRGYVTEVVANGDAGIDSTEISVRNESGTITTIPVFDEDGTDLRLVRRDPEGAAEQHRRILERTKRSRQNAVAGAINNTQFNTQRIYADFAQVQLSRYFGAAELSGDLESLTDLLDGDPATERNLKANRDLTVRKLVRELLPHGSDGETQELSKVLKSVVIDAEVRARDSFLKSIVEVQPARGETAIYARTALARMMADPSRYPSDPSDQDHTAARSLIEGAALLPDAPDNSGADPVAVTPELLAQTPAGAVARAKAVIGGGEGFGKERQKVSTFRPTTLAELEAGKVPEIVATDVFIENRAADGGPSETAAKHLDMVRQAGAAIRADVELRVAEQLRDLPSLTELKTRREAAVKARSDFYAAMSAREDARYEAVLVERTGMTRREFNTRIGELNSLVFSRDEKKRAAALQESETLRAVRRQAESDSRSSDEAKADSARYSELGAVTDELTRQFLTVEPRRRKAYSDARRAALAELRPVGGEGLKYDKGERAKATRAVRWAEGFYPSDWLGHASSDSKPITLKSVKRGYYSHHRTELALSGGDKEFTTDWVNGTAIHELGHRMEATVPGLLAAEEAFLWDRTSTGEIGQRRRLPKTPIYAGKDEHGFKDDFQEHYTGKTYGAGTSRGPFYEVFTTGVESVFAGSPYVDGDDDFQDFMLGVLATL